jgi:hypothetical protein
MRFCDNVNCDYADEALERISDYRVMDGVVLCVACAEDEDDNRELNASNVPDSGYQEYDSEVGML